MSKYCTTRPTGHLTAQFLPRSPPRASDCKTLAEQDWLHALTNSSSQRTAVWLKQGHKKTSLVLRQTSRGTGQPTGARGGARPPLRVGLKSWERRGSRFTAVRSKTPSGWAKEWASSGWAGVGVPPRAQWVVATAAKCPRMGPLSHSSGIHTCAADQSRWDALRHLGSREKTSRPL
jgi:hypothetical protein